MAGSSRDPEWRETFNRLSALVASLLEEGSLFAARARTPADAAALRQLGEDVAILSAAMAVLVRTRH